MKITIIGTGYVGLVTGVVLSEIGHEVICYDLDQSKIDKLNDGISPIYEAGLEDLMHKNCDRLFFTTDKKKAFDAFDICFIGVGTPERADGSANLDYVYQVCDDLCDTVTADSYVVIKSTVPIGTNEKIEKYLNDNSKHNIKFHVISNPEFLAQGTAVHDTLYGPRIVVGVNDEHAKEIMKELYEPLTKEPHNQKLLFMNRVSAEMVKYASNDFLALKISYINEIANFCEMVGANIEDVTQGMGYDTRIGNKFLKAGIGYGGSCFPKDTKALYAEAVKLESDLLTVKAAIDVNKRQKVKLFEKAYKDYHGQFKGKRVACLGATFKPGTDDLREAPSIENVKLLLEYGADVIVYDPVGLHNFERIFKDQISYTDEVKEALTDAEICFIFTEWKAVCDCTPKEFVQYMKDPVVYDGRNCFDPELMKKAGIRYQSIGR